MATAISPYTRRWFHLSDRWQKPLETKSDLSLAFLPKLVRADDDDPRNYVPCVCVAPSIAQCIIALGGWRDYRKVSIYAVSTALAEPASWVFDYSLTKEARIYKPVSFTRVTSPKNPLGVIDLSELALDIPPRETCGHIKYLLPVLSKDLVDLRSIEFL